jgi:propanol-preferring alcohol dehydrogenase
VRVGIPWLGWTCGRCRYCLGGRENLCELARFTGRDIDGGYAELTVADERFCFALPDGFSDLQLAPLLCAGLIGYRALKMTGEAERIGLYGFGSSAHIVAQVAHAEGRTDAIRSTLLYAIVPRASAGIANALVTAASCGRP